jgi:hypothetical protein
MNHLVFFSFGVGSWAAAKRVAEKHGVDNLTLLFTDTLIEDEDTYRFGREAAANVGGTMVEIADGRTPFEVFFDRKFLGNSRADPCSDILKRKLARRWINEYCDPEETVLYVGIDWSESHRLPAIQHNYLPYRVEAPLCEPPLLLKSQVHEWAESEGLRRQRLYDLGFQHANCGGVCVKAGQAQWALLLRTFPERYAEWETNEEAFRRSKDKDVSILKEERRGVSRPLTLRTLRERIEAQGTFDELDWGGCGCFVDEEAA